jgi:hypothetical protein
MIIMVTYDLRTPRDYHDFYEAIKQQGRWWHYLSSTWLVSTTKSPQEIVDSIHPYMSEPDSLLVCELGPNYQGWLPKDAWDWINNELRASVNALASLPPIPTNPNLSSTAARTLGKPLPPPPPPLPLRDLFRKKP